MSNFIRNFKHTVEFDGDTVQFTLETLKRKDVITLTPLFTSVTKELGEDEALEISGRVLDILQPYVISMVGLKDADGNDISLDVVFESQYFFEMLTGIVFVMLEKSNPQKTDDEGKEAVETKK